MKFILGRKLDMTQIAHGDDIIAVTRVKAGPCTVTQVKNDDHDGYKAVQVGYELIADKKVNKPKKGHLKKTANFRILREFRLNEENLNLGDVINAGTFEIGDNVQITGVSKGKGFQGVVKRHGFHGHNETHGTKDQVRMPGSIGAGEPQHVFKGMRMAGRMGGDRVSIKNQSIVGIDIENNIVLVYGGVPGARNSLVMIYGPGEIKTTPSSKEAPIGEPIKENK